MKKIPPSTIQVSADVACRFAALPAPVASGWARFAEETHEALALLRLIDCFESGLKFVAMLSLAVFKQHARGQHAENLKARLSSDLQMPSLGHFAGALRDCTAFVAGQNEISWSSDFRAVGAKATQDAINSLLSLRNDYRGHGATLDRAHARHLLDDFQPALIDFLSTIPGLPQLRLWRTRKGNTVEPIGFELPVANGVPDTLPPVGLLGEPDQLLAEKPTTGSWLNLNPLLLVERTLIDSEWRFLFYNGSSKGAVSFLDYGTGQHHRFPPGHIHAIAVTQNYPRSHVGPQWFVPLIADRTQYFVGRTDALAKLAEFAGSHSKRTLVVIAPPGLGKTTLLARWAEREPVLRHFLREADEQSCAPVTVFANLARQAAEIFGITLRPSKDTDLRSWRDELFRVLEAVSIESAAPLVVLDGLDEAERVRSRNLSKESILDWLPEPIQMPGRSRWILSTRPELLYEKRFAGRFSADYAEHLELHRLGKADVEEFVRTSGYWDVLQRYPLWVAEIVKRSEGSPLYLRLLVEELRLGTLTPGIFEALPMGLAAFFERTLHSIEEASRTSDRQLIRAQKLNAADLLRRLAERGLITADKGAAVAEEERQRLDDKIGTAGLDVLALFVIARAPLVLHDIASILDVPADELERILVPLRMVMVQAAEEQWTLFHGAFRDFVAATREPLIALACDRMRKWGLRYQDHGSPYALRHIVAHLTDSLKPGPEGPQPEAEAQNLVRVLTDLSFVALRAAQDDTAGLLADYDLALNLWINSPQPFLGTGLAPQASEPWQCEAVGDVLNGDYERHLDRGSGPTLVALREFVEEEGCSSFGVHVEITQCFTQGQEVPEEWFSIPQPPAAIASLDESEAAVSLGEFAAFVSANAHQMEAGANVPALAFNFSASGAVAKAAASMLQKHESPWVERDNRPIAQLGKNVAVRVLPSAESVCVCLDFSRFVTFSARRSRSIFGIEARSSDLRTGGELAVLQCHNVTSFQSHLAPASSSTGDRIVVGRLVADFGQKHIFELTGVGELRAVALTHDGRLVAIAEGGAHGPKRDDYVSIWDLETRTRVRTLKQSDPEVHSLAISADGRILAIGRHHGDLQIWDVARGEQLLTFLEGQHVRAVAITPDARFVVCGGSSGVVWLIDVSEARVLRRFSSAFGQIHAVALTPDGRSVAAWDYGGLFCLWDVKTGCLMKSFDAPNPYRQLQLTSDATTAVVGNRIFDLSATLPDPAIRPICIALDDESAFAVLGLKDGSVVCEAFGASRRTAIFRRGEIDPDLGEEAPTILAVHLSADGHQALIAYDDNEIYLINIANGRYRQIIPKTTWARLIADELPEKERNDARLRGDDRHSPEMQEFLRQSRPLPSSYPISHITLTPDARILVTASHGEALRAWNVASGENVNSISMTRLNSFSEGEVHCLKPLPDSSGVVFTKFDCSLHLWRFSEANVSMMLRESPPVAGPQAFTAVSSDGREVVWAASWMPLEIRSIETGNLIKTSKCKIGQVGAVEWLKNGALLLSIATDQDEARLEIWDIDSLTCVAGYPLPSQSVEIMAARKDDHFICCTQDGQFHWLRFRPGCSTQQ